VGSEVQKPLAVVVVFGLVSSIFVTMVVLPVLFCLVKSRGLRKVSE
jgi:Cu/Ag efflux pump CusA